MIGTMTDTIVEVKNLSRKFDTKIALDNVDFTITRGVVMGLVGENGAGKTTLIRHLMGLLKPQSGTVSVFGKNPVKDPEGALSHIGYLSENREMLDWMPLDELMSFTAAFYPDWDWDYAHQLIETFRLDPAKRVCDYSRGQRAQAGLILAVAHHPDLLLLDEPSSGLDPIVRKDILGEIIHTVTNAGKTVLFSSHLLDEVERVADTITFLSEGKKLLTSPLTELLESWKMITLRGATSLTQFPAIPGIVTSDKRGNEWVITTQTSMDTLSPLFQKYQFEVLAVNPMSLNDIFIAKVGRSAQNGNES
mgnify:CR=1 FL=1